MDTEQEQFWAGDFGDEYTDRNEKGVAANTALFARALQGTQSLSTIFEIGTNRGLNLDALAALLPSTALHGIEINAKAAEKARERHSNIKTGSVLDHEDVGGPYDLVFTKGVLIHIAPEKLPSLYARINALSGRYVLMAEYYSPTPTELNYRGHAGKLFKRDFAGEFMDAHRFALVDYGFAYHRDPHFPQDDTNWFLMERAR